MMRSYLEVTFRKGKPLAAYLYLPRQIGDRSARVETISPEFNVDYTDDGRPIGIEILHPQSATLIALNEILSRLRAPCLDSADMAPLAVA